LGVVQLFIYSHTRMKTRHCELCALTSTSTTVLLRCHGCLKVRYCSSAHQHADWRRHKKVCVPRRTDVDTDVTQHVRTIQCEIDTLDPAVPYVDFTHRVIGVTRRYKGAQLSFALARLQELLYVGALNDYEHGVIKIYGFLNNYFTRHFFALFQEKRQKGGFVLWCGGREAPQVGGVKSDPTTYTTHHTTVATTEGLLETFFPTRNVAAKKK
jgi:hypothetical protein